MLKEPAWSCLGDHWMALAATSVRSPRPAERERGFNRCGNRPSGAWRALGCRQGPMASRPDAPAQLLNRRKPLPLLWHIWSRGCPAQCANF